MGQETTNVSMTGAFIEVAGIGDLYKIQNEGNDNSYDCEVVFSATTPSEPLIGHTIKPGKGVLHDTWGIDAKVYCKGPAGVIIIITK